MYGFDELKNVVSWCFDSMSAFWSDGLFQMGIIGSFVVGMPILRKIVSLIRKLI